MSDDGLVARLQSTGLTQEQLAKKIGVSQSYMSKILRDERQPGRKFLAGVLREFPELGLDVMEYLEGPLEREDQRE